MTKRQLLDCAQSIWRSATNNSAYNEWLNTAIYNFDFFSGIGDKQWLPKDLEIVQARGQMPLTFNLLQSLVNNLCGVEIQSQYRLGCRIDRNDDDTQDGLSYSELSKALTHLLLNWQERENVSAQGTEKFSDALICGLGWSAVFKEDDVIRYERVSPLSVIPDFGDGSKQFTDMQYVCKKWFIPREKILKLWPKAAKEIQFDKLNYDEYSSDGPDYQSTDYTANVDSLLPLVAEVQYKESVKAFSGLREYDGRYFETFNYDEAVKIAGKKSNVDEIDATQIIRTLFIGDTLLQSAPLEPNFPNQKDFTFVPFVWARRETDGVPYGFIEPLKSIQIDLNKRITNSIYYMMSNQYIIKGAPIDGKSLAALKRELSNRNAIIQVPVGSELTVNSSIPMGEEQLKIVNEHLELFKRTSGVQDEMLGIQTNATSGLAQKIRQVNSVRSNVFAFENLATMKKREAMLAVQLFQNSFYDNFYVNVLEDSEEKQMILNCATEDMYGNKIIYNDVSFLPVTLYFDELRNVVSTRDEIREGAQMIAQNPWLLNMPSLLKDLGLKHAEKYAEELGASQAQQQQGGAQAGQQPEQNMNEVINNIGV